MSGTAVLFLVGAGLEVFGLALVAGDVIGSVRQIRAIQNDPRWEDRLPAPKRQRGALIELIAIMAAGNVWRRGAGVVCFAIGLVVQTVGNLVAL